MNRVTRHAALGLCLALLIVPLQTAAGASSDPTASTIPESADWGAIPHAELLDSYDPLLDAEFDDGFADSQEIHDPFENTNRTLFDFNQGVDRWVLSPITRGYQFVMPEPARQSIRRALMNLNSPSILVNDLLQLRFKDAGETLGRFILNTTIGMGGLFDVGAEAGWDYHSADFGQTLARAGVGSGPYLVLPVFGPNTLRDGLGDVVDVFLQPLTYLIGPAPNLMIGTGRGLAEFEAHAATLEALEESSVDYYAALRSAYIQNRRAEISDTDEDSFEPAP
jgi:phospholipid-binding lipoprotein MlaA